VYTTQVYRYDPKRDMVAYRCEGTELGNKLLKGFGHKGETKISEGKGKLIWKTEFAARWNALDIRFEAYGKELTDSVKINDWVSEHVLGFPAPYHVRYELFQDKSGKKMSKSTGNLVTPQEWLNVATPESLRFLMFKRIIGARNISLDDVPTYIDEFDALEEYYFSKERDSNVLKDAKQRGLYEYSVLLKVPKKERDHVPYRLLTQLAALAPDGTAEEYVPKRLVAYGMVKEVSEELKAQIARASRWAKKDTIPHVEKLVIPTRVVRALREFSNRLGTAKTHDEVQSAAFESLKNHGLKPNEFFPFVYQILLGVDRGPRLGPYVVDTGSEYVRGKIRAALASSKHN
jgi:lysyl-tRNA synthetase class 1